MPTKDPHERGLDPRMLDTRYGFVKGKLKELDEAEQRARWDEALAKNGATGSVTSTDEARRLVDSIRRHGCE